MTTDDLDNSAAGFVDDDDVAPADDTVFVPAYVAEPAETVMAEAYQTDARDLAQAYLQESALVPVGNSLEPDAAADPVSVDVSDLGFWEDEDPSTSLDGWDGDAPIAVALDAPPAAIPPAPSIPAGDPDDRFDRGGEPRPIRAGLSPRAPPLTRRSSSTASLERRAPLTHSFTVSELARQAEHARAAAQAATDGGVSRRMAKQAATPVAPPEPQPAASRGRRYPKMLALLSNSARVEMGSAPIQPPKPPPVPGTFFPVAKVPSNADRPDMDKLLAAMADGLLVGGDDNGSSQIIITLRDDFFRGTELHVSLADGSIAAKLVPPDIETYRTLDAEMDRLRGRLAERGLRVASLCVERP